MAKRGRPKTSKLSRAEQLRRGQQAKRRRDRAAGLVTVQLKLPRATAEKLRVVARAGDIAQRLDEVLADAVVRVADYPFLAQIAWNRTEPLISARDAFGMYERNWRFVDAPQLSDAEKTLIERLKTQFGAGLIHA